MKCERAATPQPAWSDALEKDDAVVVLDAHRSYAMLATTTLAAAAHGSGATPVHDLAFRGALLCGGNFFFFAELSADDADRVKQQIGLAYMLRHVTGLAASLRRGQLAPPRFHWVATVAKKVAVRVGRAEDRLAAYTDEQAAGGGAGEARCRRHADSIRLTLFLELDHELGAAPSSRSSSRCAPTPRRRAPCRGGSACSFSCTRARRRCTSIF
jgi:hypothetical protein